MRCKWCRSKISNNHRILFSAMFALLLLTIAAAAGSAQTIIGDVNGDGRIDVRDVILVQKHVLRLTTLTEQQRAVSDVNGDGDIDVRDVTLIMQRSIGKINSFPLSETRINLVENVTKFVIIGTPQSNIGLPATVKATLSSGATRDISVQWESTSTPAFKPNVEGSYVFMGILVNLPDGITNPGALRAKATVTVGSIPGPFPPPPDPPTTYYTVTYNSNEATGGNVPIDNGRYMPNDLVTVRDNEGNLVKVGYSFEGWHRRHVGLLPVIREYKPGQTFEMPTYNVTLYATWTAADWPPEIDGLPSIVQTFFNYEVTVTIKDEFKEQICAVAVLGESANKLPDNKRWRVFLSGPRTVDDLVGNIVIERCF